MDALRGGWMDRLWGERRQARTDGCKDGQVTKDSSVAGEMPDGQMENRLRNDR